MTYLQFYSEDVQGIFDPVIMAIEGLISDQQLKAIQIGIAPKVSLAPVIPTIRPTTKLKKAILLVGGLGASEYLYKRLKQRFEGLEIMQPKNAYVSAI